MSSTDTIFALATPPGKSGVAIIRLSGREALAVLEQLTGLADVAPRLAHYVTFRSPGGKVLDHGIALYFSAPHSFTGQDVAEFHLHGSLAVIKGFFEVLGAVNGLRPAEPGEFSRRAFLNGKMDLMEAEGLADLIEAETPAQKNQAMRQMQGELSSYYEEIRKRIINCLAHLEAYIDFPDEEIPETVLAKISDDIKELQSIIGDALAERHGERLRDGIHIVILGAPNAGKSSLLNALARRDAAIVSARAGTTRDIIEIHMDIAGYPVILADTAGLRDTGDDIEEEGVRRALARAGEADIKLVMFDGGIWPKIDAASLALLDDKALVVINKCDIVTPHLLRGLPQQMEIPQQVRDDILYLSAKTGQGIDLLLQKMEQRIVTFFSAQAAPFITRQRHRILLKTCNECLEKSLQELPLELKCEELRQACHAVAKITGTIQVDELLDVIFREFCIGK